MPIIGRPICLIGASLTKRIHSSTVQSEIGTVFLTILSIHCSLNNSGVMYLHKLYLRYSTSCGERESRPFHEEPERDIHLYFNQYYTYAPGAFCYALSTAGRSTATGQESSTCWSLTISRGRRGVAVRPKNRLRSLPKIRPGACCDLLHGYPIPIPYPITHTAGPVCLITEWVWLSTLRRRRFFLQSNIHSRPHSCLSQFTATFSIQPSSSPTLPVYFHLTLIWPTRSNSGLNWRHQLLVDWPTACSSTAT